MTHNVLVLKDVMLPSGRVADLTLTDGRLSHIGSSSRSDEKVFCDGMFVLPAGIDMHVHMRDETQRVKEDYRSGTMSALAGGVTVVIDQPNTIPPLTSPERIQERVQIARENAFCRFGVNAGVTGEADLTGCWHSGAMAFGETFAGPSSYGEAVSHEILSQAMETIRSLNGLMTIHAEIVAEGDDQNLNDHNHLRPPLSEAEAVRNVCSLNISGCRIHFCHISSEQAFNAVRGGTVEVTPHHLFLSIEKFDPRDGFGKVNPPLRFEKDRKALWSQWNKIDVIGSDHAPHTCEEKRNMFESVPSGLPGVETMIPLLMAEVVEGRIPLADIIEKTSRKPAEILGIEGPGYYLGAQADFALYEKEVTKITVDGLHSKAGWTPYEGMTAVFPRIVIQNGKIAYKDGTFFERMGEWIHGRGYLSSGEI